MKKNIFLFAIICNLLAPSKENTAKKVIIEWQDPPKEIKNNPKYIFAYNTVQIIRKEYTPCCLSDQFIMVNKEGKIRNCTQKETKDMLYQKNNPTNCIFFI